jgi:hypothetical protein
MELHFVHQAVAEELQNLDLGSSDQECFEFVPNIFPLGFLNCPDLRQERQWKELVVTSETDRAQFCYDPESNIDILIILKSSIVIIAFYPLIEIISSLLGFDANERPLDEKIKSALEKHTHTTNAFNAKPKTLHQAHSKNAVSKFTARLK